VFFQAFGQRTQTAQDVDRLSCFGCRNPLQWISAFAITNVMFHLQWDAELLTSYGWIECVGCADRSAYDLSVHAKKTGASLVVRQRLPEPIQVTEWEIDLDKKKFGPHFKKDGKAVEAALTATTQSQREELAKALGADGSLTIDVPGVGDGKVSVPNTLVKIEQRTRTENVREFIPNVIEPSFGIGRIL
jgi:glycyl-tRNA synthetase